ncbi:MAG: tRNA 2-thiouridine(34) synthase MnmA [Anaerolineales bacterium]|nr:tRNA 2-thiouridine(34) synthase MnmA [Anaerolineales bacterium]
MDFSIPKGAKIGVAMSGGVDSSVVAALLAEQGYQIFGMMLRLWSEPGLEAANRCCTPDAMARAKHVAGQLGIPFYAIDARDVFRETVVQYFIDGYTNGVTPNPCLACNRHIRWEFLLNRALALDADFMATGHYARLQREPGKPVRLLRGIDPGKDQSYVLSVLNQAQLRRAVFPIGELQKAEVRALADKFGLPSASVKDSQDLCFLAGRDYPNFLRRHAPESVNSGEIVSREGEVLGQHNGLAFYTIGQRKGLGIARPEPLYVLEKEPRANRLVVGTKDQLGQSNLRTHQVNWVSGRPEQEPFRAEVKTRYTAQAEPGLVTPSEDGQFKVQFDRPLRDITPGQAAVAYRNDEAIVFGIIRGEGAAETSFKEVKLFE